MLKEPLSHDEFLQKLWDIKNALQDLGYEGMIEIKDKRLFVDAVYALQEMKKYGGGLLALDERYEYIVFAGQIKLVRG